MVKYRTDVSNQEQADFLLKVEIMEGRIFNPIRGNRIRNPHGIFFRIAYPERA